VIRTAALAVVALGSGPARADEPQRAGGALEDPLRLDLHGYFRARYFSLHGIFDDGPGGHTQDLTRAEFMTQRLRLEPSIAYGPDADAPIGAVRFQIDALDDVVWGDNARLARTPLFASDLSATGRDGVEQPSLEVKRAWLELLLPVGQLRVGRMGSHWGMGLLANSGDGLDDDYGDNRFGTVHDKILFATRPWMVVQAARGRPLRTHPLLVAVAYDELVEDPLVSPDESADPMHDPRVPHQGWLAEGRDDVGEWVLVAIWKDDDWHRWRAGDQLHAGVYYVNRSQPETRSNVHVFDLYGRVRWGPWFGVTEGYQILGHTRAIGIPVPAEGNLPLRKDAQIIGGAARAGYERPRWTAQIEVGHASGDADISDATFTVRALHPDHHVGLVLFQEVLAEATARRWLDPNTRGLWSNGGVYNATYGILTGKLRPLSGLELFVSGLYAVPDEIDGTVVRCDERDGVTGECTDAAPDPYGFEIDAAAKVHFQEHFDWTLEGGVLFPGEALWSDDEVRDRDVVSAAAWTVQTRVSMSY
jgi:hypothetical protein